MPRLAVLAATGQWGVQGAASLSASVVSGPWSPGRARVSGARRVPAFPWRAAGSERRGIGLLSPLALWRGSEDTGVPRASVMLGRKQGHKAGSGTRGSEGGGRSCGALPVWCQFKCIPCTTSFNFLLARRLVLQVEKWAGPGHSFGCVASSCSDDGRVGPCRAGGCFVLQGSF